jgi:hypothetical protein
VPQWVDESSRSQVIYRSDAASHVATESKVSVPRLANLVTRHLTNGGPVLFHCLKRLCSQYEAQSRKRNRNASIESKLRTYY